MTSSESMFHWAMIKDYANIAQVYNLGGQVNGESSIHLWACLQELASVVAIVSFIDYTTSPHARAVPVMAHTTSASAMTTHADVIHVYQSVSSTNFILPSHKDYVPSQSSVAHTRTLGFLKRYLEGPHFDLEAIWDEHTMFELYENLLLSAIVLGKYGSDIVFVTFG